MYSLEDYILHIEEADKKRELLDIQKRFVQDPFVNSVPRHIQTLTHLIYLKVSKIEIRDIIRKNPEFSVDEVLYAFHKPDMGKRNYKTFKEYALKKGREVETGYAKLIEIIKREKEGRGE